MSSAFLYSFHDWARHRSFALQAARTFDERVPPVDERDHEAVHLQVAGAVVIDGRLVAEGETQVAVDLVAERQPDAHVVEFLPGDAIDGRLPTAVPGHVERPP